jgi:predicted RNase H-like HicB family nuclease
MRTAQFIYRSEGDGWWAASADLPGYSAVGESFEEVRRLAAEGAPWFAEQELELHHLVLGGRFGWTPPSAGRRSGDRVELRLPAAPGRLSISPSGLRAA